MSIPKCVLRCDCVFDVGAQSIVAENRQVVGTAKNVHCIRTPFERDKFLERRRETAEEQAEKISEKEPRVNAQPKEIAACEATRQKFTLDEVLGGTKTTNAQEERAGQTESAVEGKGEAK